MPRISLLPLVLAFTILAVGVSSPRHAFSQDDAFRKELEGAFAFEQQGFRLLAIDAFDRLRTTYPDEYEAHTGYLRNSNAIGRHQDMTNEYKEELQGKPGSALLNAIVGLLTMEDLVQAREHYGKALKLDPGSAEAHAGLALVLNEGRKELGWPVSLDSILGDLETAREQAAYPGLLSWALGYTQSKAGDLEKAISTTRGGLGEPVRRAPALSAIGKYYLDLGNEAEGFSNLDEAVKANPFHVLAYRIKADYFAKKARYPEAIESYKKALSVHIGELPIYNNFAWLLTTAPDPHYDPDLALAFARYAVNGSGRKNAAYLDTLAEVWYCLGEGGRAVELIDEAIGLGPADVSYYREQRSKFLGSSSCPGQ